MGLLFVLELLAITVWLDGANLNNSDPVTAFMRLWGSWILRVIVASSALFLALRYLGRTASQSTTEPQPLPPVSFLRLGCHCAAIGVFACVSYILFGGNLQGAQNGLAASVWLASGLLAMFMAATAVLSLNYWLQLLRGSGKLLFSAVAASVAACIVGNQGRSLWVPVTRITFSLVKLLLSLFLPQVYSSPDTLSIGSPAFHVEIAPECSGLEGMGLMLVFTAAWLWIFRAEFRFPQALLLAPAGLAAMFLLNTVRIAALILIGNAGAPNIALGGFHSQAGWIAFTAVTLAFPLVVGRIPWLSASRGPQPIAPASQENPTARYILPFLAILAAAMLSRAVSSNFEWLYPLRFFAAAPVLWHFRRRYSNLNWSFGGFGVVIGVAVFAMWMLLERFQPLSASSTIPGGLNSLSPPARYFWLTCRVLAAVVTVPLCEELAFRGFLPRRLASADFEKISLRALPLIPLLLAAVAFGIMHGSRWLAGSLAGLLYTWALTRRGRIGDAVIAHAVTNALLAAWVLYFRQWNLW